MLLRLAVLSAALVLRAILRLDVDEVVFPGSPLPDGAGADFDFAFGGLNFCSSVFCSWSYFDGGNCAIALDQSGRAMAAVTARASSSTRLGMIVVPLRTYVKSPRRGVIEKSPRRGVKLASRRIKPLRGVIMVRQYRPRGGAKAKRERRLCTPLVAYSFFQ